MKNEIKKQILVLSRKSAEQLDASEAMKFAQAALNLAHVIQCVCLGPDK